MPSNVDERIVAAKFDSKDFEKGVNRTIKKLDELKESLDLEKASKSIKDVGEKTKTATESMSKSLENINNRLTTFTGMIKNKVLEHFAEEFVSIFWKMENAIKSFVKSMTTDQISAGMRKYESALTSVRMIVNSYRTVKNEITGLTEKIQYTQKEAYDAIDALQRYADETSYSMEQMTDAMSKMVAAGVSLEQAEKNVQGIASACAAAGVNATEASRAFFNLSQAYSSGSLKYTDYRSLQLLNMTNENFEEQLLAAGVAAGTLEVKTGKNGQKTYKTKKSNTNGKVTAGKTFTRQGLSDSLRYNWADNEVMDYLFGNRYFIDIEDFDKAREAADDAEGRKKYLAGIKDTKAVEKYIEGLADTEDVKKILKLKTTEKERTEYLESLIEEAELVSKISKTYEDIDVSSVKNYLASLSKDDERYQTYVGLKTEKERQEYLKTLTENANVVQDYIDEIQNRDVTVTETQMKNYIMSLDKTNEIRRKFEAMEQKDQQKYLTELTKNADIANKVRGKETGTNEQALRDYIMSLDKTNERRKKFEKMSAADQKKYLKSLGDQAAAISNLGRKYDDVAIEAFLAAREARNFNDVINAVMDYVSSKWSKVFQNLFGLLDEASDFFTKLSEGGIATLFTDFADWAEEVSTAFNDGGAGSKTFQEGILSLDGALGSLFGIFNELLPSADEFGWTLLQITGELSVAMQEFEIWLAKFKAAAAEMGVFEKLQKVLANLSGVFTVAGNVIGVAFQALGTALEVTLPLFNAALAALTGMTDPIGQLGQNTEIFNKLSTAIDNLLIVLQPVNDVLGPIIEKVGEIIGVVGGFFLQGSIDAIIMNIGFFADIFQLFVSLFDKNQDLSGNGIITSVNELGDAIKSLAEWCKNALEPIGEFFTAVINDLRALFGLEAKEGTESVEDGGAFANLRKFFDGNKFIEDTKKSIEDTLVKIGDFIVSIPGKIAEFFNGLFYEKQTKPVFDQNGSNIATATEIVETPLKQWLDSIIPSAQAWLDQAWIDIQAFFGNLPEKINHFITNLLNTEFKFTKVEDDGTGKKIATEYTKTLQQIIDELIESGKAWLKQAWTDLKAFFGSLPEKINEFFGGLFYEKQTRSVFDQNGRNIATATEIVETPLKQWLDKVIAAIGDFIADIPNKVLSGIGTITNFFGKIISAIFGVDEIEGGKNDKDAKTYGTSAIQAWFNNFIEKLRKGITELPTKIKNFLNAEKEKAKKAFQSIKDWFNTSETGKSIKEWAQNILNEIKNFILELPTHITNLIKEIGGFGRTIIEAVKTFFSGEDVAKTVEDEIDGGFKGITLSGVLESIANMGTEIVNQFLSWFTGSDNIDTNIQWFIDTVVGFITSIPGKLWEKVKAIGAEISDVWNYIVDAFRGSDDNKTETQESFANNHPRISNLINAAVEWIKGIPDTLKEVWNNAKTDITKFWNGMSAFLQYGGNGEAVAEIDKVLSGNQISQQERSRLEAYREQFMQDPGTEFEVEHSWFAQIVENIKNWIINLPETLTNAWNSVTGDISKFWNDFLDFWNNTSIKEGRRDYLKLMLNEVGANTQRGAEILNELNNLDKPTDFEKDHPFLSNIIGSIQTWISNLPETISGLIEQIRAHISGFWEKVVAVFNNETLEANEGDSVATKFENAIATLFGNLPKWIMNGLNAGLEALKGIFNGITGLFKGEITDSVDLENKIKDLDEVKEAAKNITEDTAKAVAEGTEEGGEKAAQTEDSGNGFLDSIVKIGTTLWDIITVTIPEFIKSGFHWVRDNWSVWVGSLAEIFTKVTGVEWDWEAIKASIKKGVTNIPNLINQAIKDLSNLFTDNKKKKPLTPHLNEVITDELKAVQSDKAKNEVIEYYDKLGYDMRKFTGESSFLDSIQGAALDISSEIGKVLGTIFENAGPWLAGMGQGMLKFWNRIMSAVTKFFTGQTGDAVKDVGDAIGAEFSKDGEAGLGEVVKNLWASFEDFILHTVPEFLGVTFRKLLSDIPEFVRGFIRGFEQTIIETSEEELEGSSGGHAIEEMNSLENGALGIINILENVFGSIVDFFFKEGEMTTVGKIVAIVAGLLLLISLVGDIFDKFRSSEDKVKAANNGTGMIKAFASIIDLLVIVAAVSAYMTKDQFEQFEKTMERITPMLYHIMDFIAIITIISNLDSITGLLKDTGEFIGGIFDFFGDMGERFKNGSSSAKDAEGFWGKSTAFLKNFKKNADDTTKEAQNAAESVENAKEALDTDELTGIPKWIDTILNSGARLVKTAAAGLGGSFALDLIGTAGNDIFSQFIGNFGMLGDNVGHFFDTIAEKYEEVSKLHEQITAVFEIFTHVVDGFKYILEIAGYADDLDTATDVMNRIAVPISTLLIPFKGDIHAAEIVQALKDIMGLTDEMSTFVTEFVNKGDTFSQFKWAMLSLSTAVSLVDLSNVVVDPEAVTEEKINAFTEVIRKMLQNDGLISLLKEITPEKIGANTTEISSGVEILAVFATSLHKLSSAVQGFDETAKNNLIQFFGALGTIAVSYFGTGNDMLGFAAQMENLGQGLTKFAEAVTTGALTSDNINVVQQAFNVFADLASRMSSVGVSLVDKLTTGGTTLQEFASQIRSLGGGLKDFMDSLMELPEGREARNWIIDDVSTAMYAINQLGSAASKLELNDVKALQELLKDGKTLGKSIQGFFAGLTDAVYYIDTKEGPQKVLLDAADLNMNLVIKMVETFATFATALSKIGNISNYRDMVNAFVGKYRTWSMTDYNEEGVGLVGIAKAISAMFIGITQTMRGESKFFDDVDKTAPDIDSIVTFFDLFRRFTEAISASYASLNIKDPDTMRMIDPDKMLGNIFTAAVYLKDNASQLFDMIDALSTYNNETNIEKANKVMSTIDLIGHVLSLFGGTLRKNFYETTFGGFSNHMIYEYSGFAESLEELQTLATQSDLFVALMGQIVDNLSTAIDDTKISEKLKGMGTKTALLLSQSIQEAFNSEDQQFHPEITPVLNDNEIRSQLASLFGVDAEGFNISLGLSEAVNKALGDADTFTNINSQLTLVNDQLKNLGYLPNLDCKLSDNFDSTRKEIGTIATSIGNIKLYLDSDKLVGGIMPIIIQAQEENDRRYLGHVTTYDPGVAYG